ncbi:hypothetical protein SAMN05414139_04276 [Burkholderia sp. D7]|uniref:Lipoprotein n=1 Tax=Caballeronia udeis TaxID=1232866 RepID=A0A158J5B8_9BURK|nr:hypothetical protein AWB69_07198 [Caballeronia udeis]SOE91622.1 hypothetical protein SAMN05414139_04276 [Burkholderia sp. D7]
MNKSRIVCALCVVLTLAFSSLVTACSSESGMGASSTSSSAGSTGGY